MLVLVASQQRNLHNTLVSGVCLSVCTCPYYYYIKLYADDAEDPAAIPIFWVSKWVDYSDKYGLGYQLCDSSVGVLFNDSTRLLLGEDGE